MFDIDTVQRALRETGTLDLRIEQVPLHQAVGRVLAETLRPLRPHAAPPTTLKAGVRLQSKHVPQLAMMGLPMVRVFQKIKVGVLTLGGPIDAAQAPGARCTEHSVAGPMLSALLDGLGAVAITAPRVNGDGRKVEAVLDMLLKECDVVLVAGCVTEARHRHLQRTLAAREASSSEQVLCEDLGARLTVGQLGDQVVVCLPSGLAESFMTFMLLISPMIRHLQGRIDPLPESHAVTLRHSGPGRATGCGFVWARESQVRSELFVRPHAPSNPIDAIAWADGIARSAFSSAPDGMADAEYYPFSSWLQ